MANHSNFYNKIASNTSNQQYSIAKRTSHVLSNGFTRLSLRCWGSMFYPVNHWLFIYTRSLMSIEYFFVYFESDCNFGLLLRNFNYFKPNIQQQHCLILFQRERVYNLSDHAKYRIFWREFYVEKLSKCNADFISTKSNSSTAVNSKSNSTLIQREIN